VKVNVTGTVVPEPGQIEPPPLTVTVGRGYMVIGSVILVVQGIAVTIVRVTLNVPALAYVCEGFSSVLVLPSPKAHAQLTMVL
jgi:hypothetical protein